MGSKKDLNPNHIWSEINTKCGIMKKLSHGWCPPDIGGKCNKLNFKYVYNTYTSSGQKWLLIESNEKYSRLNLALIKQITVLIFIAQDYSSKIPKLYQDQRQNHYKIRNNYFTC